MYMQLVINVQEILYLVLKTTLTSWRTNDNVHEQVKTTSGQKNVLRFLGISTKIIQFIINFDKKIQTTFISSFLAFRNNSVW